MRRLVLALVLALAGVVVVATPARAGTLSSVVAPSISGTPAFGATLAADPGQWAPAATAYAFQWLRDGAPIAQASAQTYTAVEDDLGHAVAVVVTATDGAGNTGTATSAPTTAVQRSTLTAQGGQAITGVPRFTHTLDARPGRFSATPSKITYQWLRAGRPIAGATEKKYELQADDVGARLAVQLTVLAPGYQPLQVTSDPTPRIEHRVDARRVVRYHVETRGRITTSVKEFRTLAQETYDDPRGWRGAGIRFVPVTRGGAFTLVLSQASLVPGFSSGCSATWSCRVGRFVIINQDRWKDASPAWNAAHLALRDYRHMVVNHETGHWLGLHHATCPGPGRLAPVMQQQSKGLQGCRFNPFPTGHELDSRTPRGRAVAYREARGYSPDVE
jgi:uncharacterized protein DUF3152